ncbi:MAG: radical SAM protein [Planctomycetes bacterium]|nr:radical SAM protein [Planctomycetota bacterium]
MNHDSIPYEGFVDDCDSTCVVGWCWRTDRPSERVTVVVRRAGVEVARGVADRFRRDLLHAGKGDGSHAFHVELPAELLREHDRQRLSIGVEGTGFELAGSPVTVSRRIRELIVNPLVFQRALHAPPMHFGTLRVDISNTCNLDCVYCPTIALRTKERLALADFEHFLAHNVTGLDNLAIGCGQEPTVSQELCDFLEAAGRAPLPPRELFMLITNGTLLHKHDWKRIAATRLNALFLSLDSTDADVLASVRCGSKLERIQDNVRGLLAAAPAIRLNLNIVVTTASFPGIERVVEWGEALGAVSFTLREMYYPPETARGAELLEPLMLPPEHFAQLEERLTRRFGRERFCYADRLHLRQEYEDWAPRLA